MAGTANQVYIARSIAADKVDSLVKTGVSAALTLRNGDVVALGAKTKGVYALTAPAADSELLGIVYNAGVEEIEGYRIGDDPRKIAFAPGTPVNVYIPEVGDEVALTVATSYVSGTSKYLKPTVGDVALTAAAAAPDSGIAYKITGEGVVSVGNERITTIEAILIAK